MKKILLLTIACVAGFTFAHAQEQTTTKDTTIVFAKLNHDFGEFSVSAGPQTYSFEFTNTGKEPIIIQNVRPSCGCTTPGWTQEPVEPGQKGYVKATFTPSGATSFNKSLAVITNGNPQTITLYIRGKVTSEPAEQAAAQQ